MASKSTDLAVVEDTAFPALFGGDSDLARTLQENFGDEGINPMDLDRVSIPGGGSTTWELPSLTGDESVKELDGIILAWRRPRTFWRQSIDEGGGGNPPDCASDDGEIGRGEFGPGSDANPSGQCKTCPMDQWGSDLEGGRGKACREGRLLYFLREGAVLPIALSLPVTSIQPLRTYFLHLASAGKAYYEVVTTLKLDKQESQGMRWSTVNPSMKAVLNGTQAAAVKGFAETFKEASAPPAEPAAEEALSGDTDA